MLDGEQSIRAYIACVAQGVNLRVLSGREGSQMLYAAQVVMSASKKGGSN